MGIVGLGAIGLEVVKIAAPIGFRISAIRRRAGEPLADGPFTIDEIWPPDRLHDLLAKSDVVVLALPHTPGTRRLIGRPELDRIRRGAFLVNIARGKLVDDDAVVEALRDGRLGGAALDVFSEEPLPSSSPYWDLPNVIVTPHTSGAMQDYWTPLVALFSDNLRRFDDGRPLLNVVDKVAGY
jgi:phosphoglycerate dehydrogenase-like enzyme